MKLFLQNIVLKLATHTDVEGKVLVSNNYLLVNRPRLRTLPESREALTYHVMA